MADNADVIDRAEPAAPRTDATASADRPLVEAVAGVLQRPDGTVLIAERPVGKRLAGYLEFPGGKIALGESPRAALTRELNEELGITDLGVEPLVRFEHGYPDQRVRLSVYRVAEWVGEPVGREAQSLLWLEPDRLGAVPLLPANRPVVAALSLPRQLLITPPLQGPESAFLDRLERTLATGAVAGVILRAGRGAVAPEFAAKVLECARRFAIPVMLNGGGSDATPTGFAGLHLPAAALRSLTQRPPADGWVGASVHNAAEALHARRLQLDYVLIGNVRGTSSHPDRRPLGWPEFENIAAAAGIPAYAIGGVGPDDLDEVRRRWGQGVAAIRAFWVA